jgi:hypothetical protein
MTMAKNPDYQGQDYPYDGILVPPSLNQGIKIKKLTASADAATDIAFGNIVYYSQGTEKTDMTAGSDEYGGTDQQARIYLACPFERAGPLTFAYTTDAPSTPYLVPNSSITMSTYQLAAEEEFIAIELKPGMKFWGLIGNNITADVVWNYTYYCVASGLIGAKDDPDGTTVVLKGHAFRAVASFTNLNWALFEYLGKEMFDDTA